LGNLLNGIFVLDWESQEPAIGPVLKIQIEAIVAGGAISMVLDHAPLGQAVDTLRAALNEIDVGIVLLDKDLHPQFINRAFMHMWHLTDEMSVAKLDFEGLMRLVVSKQSRPMPPARFNAFVKERTMLIQAGVEDPRDLRVDDGKVIRVKCKPLPDGGRMLVYADVTDLVQQADKLKELATVDGMTGLFNRRHFFSLAEMEWSRYLRHWRPMSLLMLDIDQFKSINDRFGHDAGDHVIVQIADICRQEKRKSDVVARFGGEEFLLLLPETSLTEAERVAERLRQLVETRDLSVASLAINATISIGVAEANPYMEAIFDLIKLADQALYNAKNAGRNRVCAAA
jgi:diguanylate cyclase (GGDEF)-like protein